MSLKRLVLLAATLLPSFLRLWLWRRMGFQVGRNCYVGMLSVVVADDIRLGNDVQIYALAVVYNLREFHLGSGGIISHLGLVYSSGRGGHFRAGPRYGMGMLAMIDCTAGVDLGEFCAVGPRCIVYTHANVFPTSRGYRNRYAGVSFGDRVWLMLDVKIMPGVTIVDDVNVMPASLVARPIKRSGMFMNSYMTQKDPLVPMPRMQKADPDEAYVEQWFANLFSDLPHFARESHRFDVTVEREAGGWVIRGGRRTLRVCDGRRQVDRPASPPADTLVLLCCKDDEPRDAEPLPRGTSWLDCWQLEYRVSSRLPFWGLLRHYFFVCHGMALAEAEDEQAVPS